MSSDRPIPTVEELCQEWTRGLGGAPGTPVNGIFLSRVDSTQRLARTLLDQCVHEDEGPQPFVVAALEQSAGRGRQGREWWSPAGAGLYASLVLPLPDRERLQELPIRAVTALAEFANEKLGGECRIKWPNDLLVERLKLGGILVDAVTPPRPADSWAIVGFGLNYATPASGALAGATSVLAEAARLGGVSPSFPRFAVDAISAVWSAATSEESGWAARYMRFAAHRQGDPIRILLDEGEVEGLFRGLDERGFMNLQTASGVRLIRTGEIYSW